MRQRRTIDDPLPRRAPGGCLALCCAVILAGCNRDLPGKPNLADRPVPAESIVEFAPLYQMHCAGCHGANGKLGPAPPLDDPLFLAIVPEEALRRAIEVGRPGTPMPGFSQRHGGPLTKERIQALAEGLKTHWVASDSDRQELAKFAGDLPAYAPPADRADGVQAIDLAAVVRGQEKLFATACGDCHGEKGDGGSGAGRLNDPDFLDLVSNQFLRRIIITGRADLGMPNFASGDGRPDGFRPLSSDQIEDLVVLLASWRATPGVGHAARRTADHPRRMMAKNQSVEGKP